MVTAVPDEGNPLQYNAYFVEEEMTEQGYNYQDRSIQEISGFFEMRVDNLETPAPPPAVRSLTREKKKKNSKKRKAVSCEDSDEESSDDEKPSSKEETLSVSWQVQSFYGFMYYTQGPYQESQIQQVQRI